MESALYGIFTLVGFVSEISLVRCAHSFDFRYFTNSWENPVRTRFPWSNLYFRTWNYLNLAFVWYKELCRSQRLLLRLYWTDLHNPSYYTQNINNNWIFINNQNRVLKMLGVASNAFNFCVCRACFRPVVLFNTYDQKVWVIY